MARQHRSVPQFGNWESDGSVPYTQVFDNARKGRTTAGKLINPNDPDENPEAFSTSSDPEAPKPKNGDARRPSDSPLRSPVPYSPQHRYGNPSDANRRARQISGGSDRSPNYQPKPGSKVGVNSPLWERRGSSEGHGLAPGTPGRTRPRAGGRGDGHPEKGSAVPKFGDWDESNPSSADGYTHIFNQVREEKNVGSAKVPAVSKEALHRNSQNPNSSLESKGCGCFGWCRN